MTVKNTIKDIENGSMHIMLIDNDTGEILLSTIWQNLIPNSYLECEVKHINVIDYTMTLMIEIE